jgi:hypothetical protein
MRSARGLSGYEIKARMFAEKVISLHDFMVD